MQQINEEITIEQIKMQLSLFTKSENVEVSSPGERDAQYAIQAPLTVYPDNEKQVQEILRWANENHLHIVPKGGGTKDAYGSHAGRADIILSLSKLRGIIEHSAGDLTFTALPGTTLLEVKETLKEHGQFLPLDVPWSERSTIGGLIASNASGLKRAMYGSARDYLIASRMVFPDGRVTRTGAKVVKNVAGYDMNKLIIGSMGSLGMLTELTFKIRPIPFYSAAIVLSSENMSVIKQFQKNILDSQLEPCVVELVDPLYISKILNKQVTGLSILLLFEDMKPSVHYQITQIKDMCKRFQMDIIHQTEGMEESEQLLSRLREYPPDAGRLNDNKLVVSIKLMTLMTQVPDVYEAVAGTSSQRGLECRFSGGVFTGISRATITADWDRQSDVLQWVQRIRSYTSTIHGQIVVETAPRAIRSEIDPWGRVTSAIRLMRGIKEAFDPHGILNKGRFIGGL
jgi:glycolate oxidase FAD binding subunit